MAAVRSFSPKPSSDGDLEMLAHREQRRLRREHPIVVAVQNPAIPRSRRGNGATALPARRRAPPLPIRWGEGRGEGSAFLRSAATPAPQQIPHRRRLARINQLHRPQPLQLGQHLRVSLHFRRHEVAGGQVHERQPEGPPRRIHRRQKVVPLRLEHPLIKVRARAQDLRHLALHQLAGPRVLHLVADGHLAPGLEQAPDVGIGGVEGNAAHRHDAALGQRHVEQLRPRLGVLEEHLVEVPQPEQQQRVLGQLALDAAILRHHGRELGVAGHRPGR